MKILTQEEKKRQETEHMKQLDTELKKNCNNCVHHIVEERQDGRQFFYDHFCQLMITCPGKNTCKDFQEK